MNKLIVLVGLPLSGKSEVANQLKEKGYVVFEDNNSEFEPNKNFFDKEVIANMQQAIKDGKNVVYDSRNVTHKKRRYIINQFKDIPCKKTCIVTAIPYEECKRRNEKEKKLSEKELEKYYANWDTPYFYEGWDKINISLGKYKGCYGCPENFIKHTKDFDQNRKNHQYTLGEHCKKTCESLNTTNKTLKIAALLHDNGKLKSKHKTENNTTRYPNHNNIGAYNSLFYEMNDPLRCSILVNLHMTPYSWEYDENGERIRIKYKKMWGKQLYSAVMKLHEADVASH